jgi:hypothetical protein
MNRVIMNNNNNNNTNRNWDGRLSGETDNSARSFRRLVEEDWSSDGEASNSESINDFDNMSVHESWEELAEKLLDEGSMDIDEGESNDGDTSDSKPEAVIQPTVPRRVPPYQGYSWDTLVNKPAFKNLKLFASRMEKRYAARKLTPQMKADMDAGRINRDALDGTVLNIKSSVGQIVRWLKSASSADNTIPFNLKALAKTKVFEDWYFWALDYWNGSPQTPVNKALAYKALLKWFLTRDSYSELHPEVRRTLELLKDYVSGLKKRVPRWKYTYNNAAKLIDKGEMLTSQDLVELNRFVWTDLKRGIDKVENNLNEADDLANTKLAYRIQTNLQILLFLRLAGQRREVVVTLDDDQIQVLDDDRLIIQPLKEKRVRACGHGLEQTDLMSDCIRWWLANGRPLLKPEAHVKAWWCNTKGKPQAGKDMTKKMARHIAERFPGTHITPAGLRRQYATMFEGSEWTADMPEDRFWKEVAGIMNTGTDTLDKHYKRMMSPAKQSSLLQRINEEWNQDNDIEDKMQATHKLVKRAERPALPEKPAEDLAEYEVAEIIGKDVSKKGGLQYLVRWEGYSAEEATWEKLNNLESALKAVEEYEVKVALAKKKKKKPAPKKNKAPPKKKKTAKKKKRVIQKEKPETKKTGKRRVTKKKNNNN